MLRNTLIPMLVGATFGILQGCAGDGTLEATSADPVQQAPTDDSEKSCDNGNSEQHQINLGRTLFNDETFDGNGRTCATCHIPTEHFAITPGDVEHAYQRMQHHGHGHGTNDDPLFRALDDDRDQAGNYTEMRTRATFNVKIDVAPNITV